jgi:hypothetical protein
MNLVMKKLSLMKVVFDEKLKPPEAADTVDSE